MRIRTQGFKDQIKELGKEIDSRIIYGDNTILAEQLFNISPIVNGNILKSAMKELYFESSIQVPQYTILKYEFGLKVNGEYEYLNYGNYIVNSVEYNEDTKTYKHTCYDSMLFSMKEYTALQSRTFPMTVREYLTNLCLDCGLVFKNTNDTFANYDKVIQSDLYANLGYTFRDIFDELSQVTASTICIDSNDMVEIRYINDTSDIIDAEYLKNINVTFGKKYGPINSIVLSRSTESDNVYLQDEDSVKVNGLCELKIMDNQIMNDNNRSDYLPDILSKLNGLEYYLNDYTSTGILYYELCDRYTVQIEDNSYSCIMFNDEPEITQGVVENIFTEKPTESETDYTKADKTDRRINQAYIMVDKQNQKINALTSEVTENTEKVSQLEITVDTVASDITHKYDFLQTDEGTDQLDFDNSLEYKPVSFNIQGYTENFLYLFPMEAKLKELHIEGKSEQETRSGKNKFNSDVLTEKTVNGITLTKNKNGTITLNGTATADAIFGFSGFSITGTGNETMSLHRISGTGTDGRKLVEFALYEDDNFTNMISATVNNNGHQVTKTLVDGVTYQFGDIYIAEGLTCNNFVVGIQVEDGKVTDFEQYGAMPSPDYPSEIKTIPSIINLFNKDAEIMSQRYFGISGQIETATATDAYLQQKYIEVKSNTKYTLSNGKYIRICEYDANKNFIKITNSGTSTNITVTTSNETKYVRISFNGNLEDFMFEIGSIAHPPVPYGAWAKVKITGKNKWNNPLDGKKNGIILTNNDDGTINLIGTATAQTEFVFYSQENDKNIINGATYTLSCNQTVVENFNITVEVYNGLKWISAPFILNNQRQTRTAVLDMSNATRIRFAVKVLVNGTVNYSNLGIQFEKSSTATDYEAYKEKEVLIDLNKPNLFDKDNVTNGYYLTNEGVETVSTYWCVSDYIEVVEKADYTYRGIASPGSAPYSCYYDKDKNFISSFHQTTGTNIITVPENACYVRFSINISVSDENKFVLFEGYTDYYELCSNNDTKDELSIIDGQVVIDKKIDKVILNGSESGLLITEKGIIIPYTSNVFANRDKNNYSGYCSHFGFNTDSGTWGKLYHCGFNVENTFWIRDDKLISSTLDGWVSWLNANKPSIYYPLVEPKQITLPNTNIELFDGVNHITLVDDLETTITAVYDNNSNEETSLSGTNTVTITDCIERNLYPSDDLYPLGIIEGSCN